MLKMPKRSSSGNLVITRDYLSAKKDLDDRSLNRQVWEHLVEAVHKRAGAAPLRVLEVGCGIGTMCARLIDWGLLTQAEYTGIDVNGELIREAWLRCHRYAAKNYGDQVSGAGEALILKSRGRKIQVNFEVMELFDFLDARQGKSAWDLLVAHAFLDLIDLDTALPRLLALLASGGLFYFTLNFDGTTIFEPVIDPDLDRRIETLYHRTMDTRRYRDRPAGSSLTGRRLLARLRDAGARLLAVGSSDWVVFSGPDGYPGQETYFLHCIIDTIAGALRGHPELDRDLFEAWLVRRHRQIDAGELIYIAHQLDVLGYIYGEIEPREDSLVSCHSEEAKRPKNLNPALRSG
jgi:SAM-dependent methyltransferase